MSVTYVVEVIDPPENSLTRPLRFRLGPFESRDEAEKIALRAKETNTRAETRIVERQ